MPNGKVRRKYFEKTFDLARSFLIGRRMVAETFKKGVKAFYVVEH